MAEQKVETSMASTGEDAQPCDLPELPPEVRNRIYRAVLSPNDNDSTIGASEHAAIESEKDSESDEEDSAGSEADSDGSESEQKDPTSGGEVPDGEVQDGASQDSNTEESDSEDSDSEEGDSHYNDPNADDAPAFSIAGTENKWTADPETEGGDTPRYLNKAVYWDGDDVTFTGTKNRMKYDLVKRLKRRFWRDIDCVLDYGLQPKGWHDEQACAKLPMSWGRPFLSALVQLTWWADNEQELNDCLWAIVNERMERENETGDWHSRARASEVWKAVEVMRTSTREDGTPREIHTVDE